MRFFLIAAAIAVAVPIAGCGEEGTGKPADAAPTQRPQGLTGEPLLDSVRAVDADGAALGTYLISFCYFRCAPEDTARAFMSGTLTLLPDQQGFEGVFAGLAPANACLRLDKPRETDADGLSSASGPRPLHWRRFMDGTVEFTLTKTDDAEYFVEAVMTPDGFVGVGTGSGIGGVNVTTRDHVAARRIGPADPDACGLPAR
ncbi:MAG TPA: hypothetical protein VK610_08600 [Rhodothermales bacterium]|nr:hypothetical protein [Rhodothermales bacterium]